MVYEMTPNKIFTHRWLPVDGCIELTGGVPEKVKNLPGLLALNDNGKAADRLFFDLGKFSYKILVTNFVKFNGNGYWLIIKCHFWSHIPKKFLKECQIWPKIVAFITPKITFFLNSILVRASQLGNLILAQAPKNVHKGDRHNKLRLSEATQLGLEVKYVYRYGNR